MPAEGLGKMYRRLDPKEILLTTETLHQRIEERFPNAGLGKVCQELNGIATEAAQVADFIRRPNWSFRLTLWGVSLTTIFVLGGVLGQPSVRADFGGISDYIQGIQALAQIFVYAGAIVFFLVNWEHKRKQARVLKALHGLRSIAHVVDMHQLTKDPERICNGFNDTASSPKRTMSSFELERYLNYCSEMLAIVSKIAVLYVQDLTDATSSDAAADIEDLTTGLSRKIWQKIILIERLVPHDTHPETRSQPLSDFS